MDNPELVVLRAIQFVSANDKLVFSVKGGAVLDGLTADRALDRIGGIAQHDAKNLSLSGEHQIALLQLKMSFAEITVGKNRRRLIVVLTVDGTVQYELSKACA